MKEKINSILKNKILLRVLWIMCLVLFLVLFARYKKYKQMKLYYNNGVEYMKINDYELAERYFLNALWQDKTKGQECKIRINLALSIVLPITPESVTPENLDEQIARLEEARDYLIENDCAHMDDSNGHNKQAQTLKEEIDRYIEELKEQNKEPDEEDKTDEQKQDEKNKQEEEKKRQEAEKRNEQNKKQMELEETFNKIEQQGIAERNASIEQYDSWKNFGYSSGQNW